MRLWAEALHLLDDNQSGFRKDRSTADATQIMIRIHEDTEDLIKRLEGKGEEIEEGEQPTAKLLDLRKAYPRVNKPALWKLLKKYGMGEISLSSRIYMKLQPTRSRQEKEIVSHGCQLEGLERGVLPPPPCLISTTRQVCVLQSPGGRERQRNRA